MSTIRRLNISAVRNIHELVIRPSPTINILYGENGSGKTSVLESIHLLASGRSFRTNKLDPLINSEQDEAIVFAELGDGKQIGLSKSRRQNHQLKFQSEKQRSWENVARELPVQILDSHSFLLLDGGPKSRRQFLDWGVFHVEQSFVSNWRKSKRALAHRNQLLKHRNPDDAQLAAWDTELCHAANEVHLARDRYFKSFLPLFVTVYQSMSGAAAAELLEIDYERGWDEDKALAAVLAENREIDIRYGATQSGPHRADLSFRIRHSKAVEILSRGQQKILVSAMKITQGVLLSQALNRSCIFLVDDLPSELDQENRVAVFKQLLEMGGQVFVSCVDISAILDCLGSVATSAKITKFHVEHGTITA